jgi:4-hydroxy-tetrahydrodipicolinate synthase
VSPARATSRPKAGAGSGPARLRGALAAAVTPLRDHGLALDDDAIAPYVAFLADGGVDGILALGTTGEGVLLTVPERRRALRLFVEAARGRLPVIAHCGAQTTEHTVILAADAAERGAAAVAVIAPPYYALGEREQLAHFEAAALACAPLPFYVYEFAARSGYAVAPETVARLHERAPNLAGLKVSDTPAAAVLPYLAEGLDVFVGSEALLPEVPGAVGTVSGLGAVAPEIVAGVVREWLDGTAGGGAAVTATARAGELRALLGGRFPAHAKVMLGLRGLPVRPDVRAPLLPLDDSERAAVAAALEGILA